MQILGQYDTSGNYRDFTEPTVVFQLGDKLVDNDGFVQAVKDQYGDWVSPTLLRYGLKSVMKIEEENNG